MKGATRKNPREPEMRPLTYPTNEDIPVPIPREHEQREETQWRPTGVTGATDPEPLSDQSTLHQECYTRQPRVVLTPLTPLELAQHKPKAPPIEEAPSVPPWKLIQQADPTGIDSLLQDTKILPA